MATAETITFAKSLLGENCHEELVNLNNGEIKALEQMQNYLAKYIQIIDEFGHAIKKLNYSKVIRKEDFGVDSPFLQIWEVFCSQNSSVCSEISKFVLQFGSSLAKRFKNLRSYCEKVQDVYKSERTRIDNELKTECDKKQQFEKRYEQYAFDVERARRDSEKQKASMKETNKTKEKLIKARMEHYQTHNDYTLALKSTRVHQSQYQSAIIPSMMKSMQTAKQEIFNEWKYIFRDFIKNIKTCGEQSIALVEAVQSEMDKIGVDNAYDKFLRAKGKHFPSHQKHAFSESLLKITNTDDLHANEIARNDYTRDQLETKNDELKQLLKLLNDKEEILNEKATSLRPGR